MSFDRSHRFKGFEYIRPKPPKREEIEGYGLEPERQYWRRNKKLDKINLKYQAKADSVEKGVFVDFDSVQLTGSEQKELDLHFKRRQEGMYFYNKGELCYITPSHYFYLTCCIFKRTEGHRAFRKYQMEIFYLIEIVVAHPIWFGLFVLKCRRMGASECLLAYVLNVMMQKQDAICGLLSKVSTDAKKVLFIPLNQVFNRLHHFDKVEVQTQHTQKLHFGKKLVNRGNATASKQQFDEGINSTIEWSPTKTDAFDGWKTDIQILDELFKMLLDPSDLVETNQPSCERDNEKMGVQLCASTLGFGKEHQKWIPQYQEFWEGCDIDEMTEEGTTITGIVGIFYPAHETAGKFIDKYGDCDEEAAYRFHKGKYDSFEKAGKIEKLTRYKKNYPLSLEDIWEDAATEVTFGKWAVLSYKKRLKELKEMPIPGYTMGVVEFLGSSISSNKSEYKKFDPAKFGRAGAFMRSFDPDNDRARWKVAYLPHRPNHVVRNRNGIIEYPKDFEYCAFVDLIKFGEAGANSEGSKISMHIFRCADLTGDGGVVGVPVAHYLWRPKSVAEGHKDILAASIFWGAPTGFERIDESFQQYYIDHDCQGLLMKDKKDDKYGYSPIPKWFQDGATMVSNFSDSNIEGEDFDYLSAFKVSEETLEQTLKYTGTSKSRTLLDSYVSFSGGLLVMNYLRYRFRERKNTSAMKKMGAKMFGR